MKRTQKDNSIVSNKPTKIKKPEPKIYIGGDFEKLITRSSIFIDKSLFIEEIVNSKDDVTLITMPRRWGKSLNLEMLKKFLEIQVDGNGGIIEDKEDTLNYKLFAGGEVKIKQGFTEQNIKIEPSKLIKKLPEAIESQGEYPVIFMDFKNCKGNNFAEVQSKLFHTLTEIIRKFSYLKDSIEPYKETTIGGEFHTLLHKAQNGDFNSIIKDLCALLSARYQKKVWVLIDEYDAAANKAYREFDSDSAKAVVDLFRDVFEPIFKGNEYLEKGVLTGVQYIVQSGMLSGLNNLAKYNITSKKYSQYYGINPEEMSLLLEHFAIAKPKKSKIKDWYNGYQENIGTDEEKRFIDKYNIWSVVNYLNRQDDGFKSYWEKSGSIDFMRHLFKKQEFKEKIELLVSGGSVQISPLKEDFTVEDFNSLKEIISIGSNSNSEIDALGLELIFSYFFITGYLTAVIESPTKYQLPNKELIKEFGEKIQEYYKTIFHIDPQKFLDLTNMLSRVFDIKSTKEIQLIFKNEFAPTFDNLIKSVTLYTHADANNSGLFANEDLMHSLLNNIALQIVNSRFASERYTTKPDGSKGRADIVIEKNGTGVVIEMKYDGNSTDALEQSKQYEQLIDSCTTKVFIGCNISTEQEVLLSGEIIVNDEVMYFEYP